MSPRGIPGSGPTAGKHAGVGATKVRAGRTSSAEAISKRGDLMAEAVSGIIADYQEALTAQAAALQAVDGRNRELLKSLVKSRKQVQKLTAGYRRTAAGGEATSDDE